MHRPVLLIALAVLSFAITATFIIKLVIRDPLEVSFTYAGSGRLVSDYDTLFFLTVIYYVSQAACFVGAIVTGIGLLKRQNWSWCFALGLHILSLLANSMAVILLPLYDTNFRIALIAISLPSLYLLSRKDIRNYLRFLKT